MDALGVGGGSCERGTPVQRFTGEKFGVDNLIPVKVLIEGYLVPQKPPPPLGLP